jgi:mannose-6-phosphate isomerase-like protein (cupin superfamily)
MLIKSKEAVKEIHQENYEVWDYRMPSKETGLSVQKLDGRVPKKGWTRNTVCNEIYFILNGHGTVFVDNKKFEVGKGDVVVIRPGEKSYIKANKKMRILTITTPDWYPDQCEFLDK